MQNENEQHCTCSSAPQDKFQEISNYVEHESFIFDLKILISQNESKLWVYS